MVQYGVALFHSAAHVMRGEKVLNQAGIRVKLIPTPRQLSSDCGMALRFEQGEAERVTAILAENRVPVKDICPI
jgi:Putative Se/S carrier protein-like